MWDQWASCDPTSETLLDINQARISSTKNINQAPNSSSKNINQAPVSYNKEKHVLGPEKTTRKIGLKKSTKKEKSKKLTSEKGGIKDGGYEGGVALPKAGRGKWLTPEKRENDGEGLMCSGGERKNRDGFVMLG